MVNILKTRLQYAIALLVLCSMVVSFPSSGLAQDEDKNGITFSNPVQSKWKIGTKIIGGAKPALNVLITLPVPTDWPEQTVTFDDVVVESESRVLDNFRTIDGGVHQLVVKMPRLAPREQVTVSVTCLSLIHI